jgi:hypothetical protein
LKRGGNILNIAIGYITLFNLFKKKIKKNTDANESATMCKSTILHVIRRRGFPDGAGCALIEAVTLDLKYFIQVRFAKELFSWI